MDSIARHQESLKSHCRQRDQVLSRLRDLISTDPAVHEEAIREISDIVERESKAAEASKKTIADKQNQLDALRAKSETPKSHAFCCFST